MRLKLLLMAALLVVLPLLSFGAVVGTNDPNQFAHYIDWCVNFGCKGGQFATPQSWVGSSGATGMVGLVDTQQAFYNLQQGNGWNGNFDAGMGLIYNGSSFGNIPTDIAVIFDEGQTGAGAWIQANWFGGFEAIVTAFDINYLPLGSFTLPGVSNNSPGTALFIGLMSNMPEIYALQFRAMGVGGNYEPDFAIGMVKYGVVPEPSSLLLMGAGLLALGAFARRRRS